MDSCVSFPLADISTLGVIAPQVPLLLQLVIPLVVTAFGALLMALPRLTLTLAHCLYFRLVPRSVIDRALPGVQGRGFQGLTTSEFVDRYAFRAAGQPDEVREAVIAFFQQHGAQVEETRSTLAFSRGSRFCSYFLSHVLPCPETRFLQTITVDLKRDAADEVEVRVDYAVRAFCMLRVMPSGLQAEISALQRQLGKN